MAERAVYALVSGIVQGVGFRAFTKSVARRLGLKGFVRNLPDGRVEVYAEGPEESVETLIDELRKGPPLSRVDKVEYEYVEPRGYYEDFTIAY
jgi:acylphosphatase